jgi:DNA-binding response OmpR family regulator
MTALLVDDNQLVTEAMEMILQNEGFEVDVSDNVQQALESLGRHVPDIIITDIVMPDMDGLEFIRCVRSISERVPILAISGMGPEGGRLYLKQAEKMGASMTLSKPVKRDRFLESIHTLLGMA